MTNKKRDEYIRILIEAKKRIAADQEAHICFAIIDQRNESRESREALRCWILSQLAPNISYGGWLSEHHPKTCMTHDDIIAGRLQWLDAMIEELKK